MFENHTVFDNLAAGAGRPAQLVHACCWRAPTKAESDRIDEILAIIRLGDRSSTCWRARLSHGQKQWLEIGMLLAQDRSCCWSTSRSPA